jgi:hypothetical protein
MEKKSRFIANVRSDDIPYQFPIIADKVILLRQAHTGSLQSVGGERKDSVLTAFTNLFGTVPDIGRYHCSYSSRFVQ